MERPIAKRAFFHAQPWAAAGLTKVAFLEKAGTLSLCPFCPSSRLGTLAEGDYLPLQGSASHGAPCPATVPPPEV